MDSIPPFKSMADKVADKLQAYFGVTIIDQKFVEELISEIIREDQLSRMGSLVNFLKIPETVEEKKDE